MFLFIGKPLLADDTCVFSTAANEVPPNIMLLLDNGAEMEHAVRHPDFDDSLDYTPVVGTEVDAVPSGAAGNGFFLANGYGVVSHSGLYYLVPILDNLQLGTYGSGLPAGSSDAGTRRGTWTINGRTVSLPAAPSTAAVDGVIDNAANFRYSKNYLNWLFFSGNYAGDGSDLVDKSRFYYAKQALMTVSKTTANQAKFGVYRFTSNADGASNVQPLGNVVLTPLADNPADNLLVPSYVNAVNNMGTVTYSPLAEGLADIGGKYNSESTKILDSNIYCQKQYVIVVSAGVSSEDLTPAANSVPATFADYDADLLGGTTDPEIGFEDITAYQIPINQNGSTYLDDVAYYLYANDIIGYIGGFQNVMTYTVGFMGNHASNLFLINTSNNGNGHKNLYDTTDPDYGKHHFTAESPDTLAARLLAAINDIISQNETFTAPVVPVTRTVSGNRIYMALFKPNAGNFWEGRVVKFGISEQSAIVDANGNDATFANGALKEDAVPYWSTKNWADSAQDNYIHNTARNIYTYLGASADLSDSSNAFHTNNSSLTAPLLGHPVNTAADIINFVRGADVFDEDGDNDTLENRAAITGDILHSEPLIFNYDDHATTMVFYGANDGMLHAVNDTDGTEAWAFIPPDLLSRLKNLAEGTSHEIFIDSSPKAYVKDVNNNGIIETTVDSDEDGDIDADDWDQVIIVCGERAGGTGYFALDVTVPAAPRYLWRINRETVGGVLELTGISGTFQDNESLSYLENFATADGTRFNFLRYDQQVSDFTVGTSVSGTNSNATATIEAVIDLGSNSGLLELTNITGAFQDDEGLSVQDRLATADGAQFTFLRYGNAQPENLAVGGIIEGQNSHATATINAVSTLPAGDQIIELIDVNGLFQATEPLLQTSVAADATGPLFNFLHYSGGQADDFTVGGKVSQNSGAWGIIDKVMDLGGNTGILAFATDNGTFQDGESLEVTEQAALADGNQFSNGLRYDAQQNLIKTGKVLTGGTSGATGTVDSHVELSAGAGLIFLQSITGTFQDLEDLWDGPKVVAAVDGTLIPQGIRYDGQTAAFTAGMTITGATSEVTRTVTEVIDLGGNTGILAFATDNDTLLDNEGLEISRPVAVAVGTLTAGGLHYDGQTASFEAGMTVTGDTSGDNGSIASVTDLGGNTGLLELAGPSGTFQDNDGLRVSRTVAVAVDSQVENALRYDARLQELVIGSPVSGGLSGAAGTIATVTALDAQSGYLTLNGLTGTFQDNEGLLGSAATTAAAVNGNLATGLRFDAQVRDFNPGGQIKGQSSADTAIIAAVISPPDFAYDAGILELTGSSGIFLDNESLIGSNEIIAAQVDGSLLGNYLHYDNKTADFSTGAVVTGQSSGATGAVVSIAALPQPEAVVPELGESWSEPKFGQVRDSNDAEDPGRAVYFIGAGYQADNSLGKAVIVGDVFTGAPLKIFKNNGSTITAMDYSFASAVTVVDADGNGFVDKIYIGDTGSQLWRLGQVSIDADGGALVFPNVDENLNNWAAKLLFLADSTHARKFFYPPSVTLEKGYDLIFSGSGDRDDACNVAGADRLYAVKDAHTASTYSETDLIDVTDPLADTPDLNGADQGWYMPLATGEKVLAEGAVFNKVFYATTFTPNNEPCLPGGSAKLYKLNYLTGGASVAGQSPSTEIGGGIPSKPVFIIPETGKPQKLFISVGSTTPDQDPNTLDTVGAGIISINPNFPTVNFFYLWWKEIFD